MDPKSHFQINYLILVDKIISGVEFFFLILLLWIIGRYGNLAPKVTDWKPLSAVNSHLVLASDEIFKTLNEPDICALLHQKRYKSYWTLTPIPCYFMTPSDADCIVHTAFLKASKEGGIPYDDNSRSGYNLSVAVVRLRSTGGFIIH